MILSHLFCFFSKLVDVYISYEKEARDRKLIDELIVNYLVHLTKLNDSEYKNHVHDFYRLLVVLLENNSDDVKKELQNNFLKLQSLL